MKRLLFLLGAVLGCLLTAAAAQTNAPPKPRPLPPGDRFLLVVDTSSGMSRLGHASRQAVVELIWSGLQGHMRPGDTYGVWTFNEHVYAGRLPMQVWRTNTLELASLAGRFLREQRYEKQSRPAVVVTNLQPVLRHVRDLIVLIISDGRNPLEGTPFDDAINAAYKERAAAARKAKQPLITTLVGRGGELVRWSVTQSGEKIDLPEHLPPPPPVVAVTNAAPALATNARRAPIIIARSQPRESPPTNADAAPVETIPSTPPPAPPLQATESSHETHDLSAMPASEAGGASTTTTAALPSAAFVRTAAPSITLRPKDTSVAEAKPGLLSAPSTTPDMLKLLSPLPVAARELPVTPAAGSSNPGPVLAVVPAPQSPAPFGPLWMFAAGSALLLAAIALTVIFIHRQQHAPRPSIISQSIDWRDRDQP
jgi:hypothetical protein